MEKNTQTNEQAKLPKKVTISDDEFLAKPTDQLFLSTQADQIIQVCRKPDGEILA